MVSSHTGQRYFSVPVSRVRTQNFNNLRPLLHHLQGYVMIGFSIGSLVGPPIGGVLYSRLGYRAPFIFILCLGKILYKAFLLQWSLLTTSS